MADLPQDENTWATYLHSLIEDEAEESSTSPDLHEPDLEDKIMSDLDLQLQEANQPEPLLLSQSMDLPKPRSPTNSPTGSNHSNSTGSSASSSPSTTTTTGNNNNNWQLRAKNIGLTYPQCIVDKSEMLKHLHTLVGKWDPLLIIVSQEDHESGQPHLHAYIKIKKQLSTRNQRFFDFNKEGRIYHPNIQTVRKDQSWISYITKDGHYETYPSGYKPNTAWIKKQKDSKHSSTLTDIVVQDIKSNNLTAEKVYEKYPKFFFQNQDKIERFIMFKHQKEVTEQNKKIFESIKEFVGNHELINQRIAGWLNDNILKPHQFRQKNLWIWGKTQLGKTQLIENLKKNGVTTYSIDYTSKFYDGMHDGIQLISFDEFKAQKTITEMNKLCDGSTCQLDTKGSHYEIKRPLPVIVTSNFSISGAYSNSDADHLETLKGRFLEIEVKQPIVVNIIEKTHQTQNTIDLTI